VVQETLNQSSGQELSIELAILAIGAFCVAVAFLFASTQIVLAGIVVSCSLVCLASILLLHALPTGYNPIRNAVSDYGVGKYRVWHRTAVLSLAAAGFALAIASTSSAKPESDVVIGFLVVFALARTIIPFFPTDIEGQTFTTRGRVHWGLAIIAFASIAFAAGFYKGTILDDAVGWVVVATAGLLIASLVLPRLRRILGLFERVFYFSMICWLLVTGIELVLLAR
jgi:hypothetical protein